MRESNIYEFVENAQEDRQENLYEITYPYGLNIYEQVDSVDPNKDHQKEKISRRLKVLLITVSVLIGILIAVLCPLLIIRNKHEILIPNSTIFNNNVISNVSNSSENITTPPEMYLTKMKFPENLTESNEIWFTSRLTAETTEKTSVKSKTTQVDLF